MALEGKTRRGSKQRGAADAPLLAALRHRLGVVLGQAAVDDKTSAIGAAGAFLLTLVLAGRVVTAAALLAQRALAQAIVARGGDDLLAVRATSRGGAGPARCCSATRRWPRGPPSAERSASTAGGWRRGGWPPRPRWSATATGPACRRCCGWSAGSSPRPAGRSLRQETAYAVTSRAPGRRQPRASCWRSGAATGPARTGCTDVRDVTCAEDRAQVRAGTVPPCLAACRTLASGLLRPLGAANIAAATRRYAAQPDHALAALGLPYDFA